MRWRSRSPGLLIAVLDAGKRNAMRDARDWQTRFDGRDRRASPARLRMGSGERPPRGDRRFDGNSSACRRSGSRRSRTGWRSWSADDRERVATRFDERVRGQGEADTLTYLVDGAGGAVLAGNRRGARDPRSRRPAASRRRHRAHFDARQRGRRHERRCSRGAPAPAAAPRRRRRTPDGVFLIHGLGGTQYDLGSMHKRLKNAGFVTHSLTLPGHGTNPEDLAGVTAEDWIDAVVAKYREVRDQHPRLHVMGMCMGALLAAVVAQREKHAKGNLVHARAAGVHRRLGHAVVSRPASAAVRSSPASAAR